MRIGIVGGVDRNAGALQDIAHARGHQLELHTGVLASAASAATLRALVGRSELVVIVTDINSHNGVRTARREAQRRQRSLKLVRRMGATQFAALLAGLGQVDAGAA
jgi:hypothetical protein